MSKSMHSSSHESGDSGSGSGSSSTGEGVVAGGGTFPKTTSGKNQTRPPTNTISGVLEFKGERGGFFSTFFLFFAMVDLLIIKNRFIARNTHDHCFALVYSCRRTNLYQQMVHGKIKIIGNRFIMVLPVCWMGQVLQ